MARRRARGVIGPAWWRLLESTIGFSHDDFKRLPPWKRRGLVFAFWATIAFILIVAFDNKGSHVVATVIVLGVFGLLAVPPYERLGRYGSWIVPLGIFLLAVTYPFYLRKLFTVPVFGSFPDVSTAVYMLVFVIMAIGLNMVVGYAGLLDLGYVAFYAMGAYTAGWFASEQFSARDIHIGDVGATGLPGFHISLWLIILMAAVFTAVIGVIIGLPTLRLRGDYLAIVTLGFGEIMPQIARNGNDLFNTGFNLTNGPTGITPIDAPGFGHTLSSATGGVLPENFLACCSRTVLGHQIGSADLFFWTGIALVLITVFCSIRLRDSRLGRAWIAIREDEIAAAAMGIPLMRTKTWAYASGAFFGGIAGAFYASFKASVFYQDFYFNISVFILCMVILGGMGNLWGVMLGGAFLAYLDREGLSNTGSWLNDHILSCDPNLQNAGKLFSAGCINVPLVASGIYGLIILLVMLLRPEGLIPDRRRQVELHEGVHDQPLFDVDAQTG